MRRTESEPNCDYAGNHGSHLSETVSKATYSCYYEILLNENDFGLSRKKHNKICNSALLEQLEALEGEGIQLHDQITNIDLINEIQATPEESPHKLLTWEHCPTSTVVNGSAGVMRLVSSIQHRPGSEEWRAFHPDYRNRGGYHEWALPAGAPDNKKQKIPKKTDFEALTLEQLPSYFEKAVTTNNYKQFIHVLSRAKKICSPSQLKVILTRCCPMGKTQRLNTLLHIAVKNGYPPLICELLFCGEKTENLLLIQNYKGNTIAHNAAEHNRHIILKDLRTLGADLTIKNKLKQTVADIVQARKFLACLPYCNPANNDEQQDSDEEQGGETDSLRDPYFAYGSYSDRSSQKMNKTRGSISGSRDDYRDLGEYIELMTNNPSTAPASSKEESYVKSATPASRIPSIELKSKYIKQRVEKSPSRNASPVVKSSSSTSTPVPKKSFITEKEKQAIIKAQRAVQERKRQQVTIQHAQRQQQQQKLILIQKKMRFFESYQASKQKQQHTQVSSQKPSHQADQHHAQQRSKHDGQHQAQQILQRHQYPVQQQAKQEPHTPSQQRVQSQTQQGLPYPAQQRTQSLPQKQPQKSVKQGLNFQLQQRAQKLMHQRLQLQSQFRLQKQPQLRAPQAAQQQLQQRTQQVAQQQAQQQRAQQQIQQRAQQQAQQRAQQQSQQRAQQQAQQQRAQQQAQQRAQQQAQQQRAQQQAQQRAQQQAQQQRAQQQAQQRAQQQAQQRAQQQAQQRAQQQAQERAQAQAQQRAQQQAQQRAQQQAQQRAQAQQRSAYQRK
jgi:hypothetical protein